MLRRILVAVALCFVIGFPSSVHAEPNSAVVMKVSAGGRVIRSDGSFGSTLKKGDILRSKDRLKVPNGSVVDIALDSKGQNIFRAVGPANILISSLKPTRLQLVSGEIFAKLDRRNNVGKFEVKTPTAVASVRGTHFQASYVRGMSEFACLKGFLRVSGIRPNGRANIKNSVFLNPGEKTQVRYAGKSPEAAQQLTAGERNKFLKLVENIRSVQRDVDTRIFDVWLKEAKDEPETKEKADKGFVIF